MLKLNKNHISNLFFFGFLMVLLALQFPKWKSSYEQQGKTLQSFTTSNLKNSKEVFPIQGEAHLYFFWTTWCAPCKAQFKLVEAFTKGNPHLQSKIIAVNLGESPELVEQFIKENGYKFHFVIAPKSAWQDLNIAATPTLVLVNKQSQIEYHTTGLSPLIIQRTQSLLDSSSTL